MLREMFPGFPGLDTVDIWAVLLCGGGCPVNHRMFSSVPGPYPLMAQSYPQGTKSLLAGHHWAPSSAHNAHGGGGAGLG